MKRGKFYAYAFYISMPNGGDKRRRRDFANTTEIFKIIAHAPTVRLIVLLGACI